MQRRDYNIGPRRLTDEGKDWLLDFDNLRKYGAVSLEGRCIMLGQNFAGCELDRYALSELYKDADFSKRVLSTGLQTSQTPIVSETMLTAVQPKELLPLRQDYVRQIVARFCPNGVNASASTKLPYSATRRRSCSPRGVV